MSEAANSAWSSTFRWEQDRAGGAHGVATFTFPLANREISLQIESFKEAHELRQAIDAELKAKRFSSRASLLAEIARIKP